MNTTFDPPTRTPRIMKFLLASGMLGCLFTAAAQAEWYVGGYGGISVPGGLSNVTVSN